MPSSGGSRRVRVERRIYQQPNGKYAVCVRVDGRARFRTVEAATLAEAITQRDALQNACRLDGLPLSPRLTLAEIADRWLAEFEAKVAAGERRDRTLDLYRSQRGYVTTHPFHRLERDERPHPLRSDQRVLTQNELARLFAACPARYRPLLLTGAYTGMRLSEVLGLAWDDVDFAAGVIHVRHQLARGRRGIPPHRIPPKTRAPSARSPFSPSLPPSSCGVPKPCHSSGSFGLAGETES
jgi:integrase